MIRRLRRTFDALRARGRFEREMREELDAHVQHRADDLTASGMGRTEAQRQARVELGAIESYKEQCRDERGLAVARPFLGLWSDVSLAARRLAATPLFLLFAVVSLSLGIGVTTAAYSILYALLWKPLGITDVDNVAVVTIANDTGRPRWRNALSLPDFEELRHRQRVFSDVAAAGMTFQTMNSPAASEMAGLESVSGNFFATVGLESAIGRTIQPGDDDISAAVVVISDRLWRRQFEADSGIVGKTVRIGGHAFEIIGVMPGTFEGLHANILSPAGWIPLRTSARFLPTTNGIPAATRADLTVIGRVIRDRSIPNAAVELAAMGAVLDREAPLLNPASKDGVRSVAKRQWSARPIASPDDGASPNRMGATLIAIVGLVLVVACTNLANLMLSRSAARQHEIAVRRALGASRWRLVRELLVETVLIAAVGGVVPIVVLQALLHVAT
ncbi:MAG TPA: ABC transporter permease, partial [Rhizomicrobium sp.]